MMTRDEFIGIWRPARNAYRAHAGMEGAFRPASEQMAALIGKQAMKEHTDWDSGQSYPMDEGLKQLLISLVGPHGPTLFKVLEIKKGVSHE